MVDVLFIVSGGQEVGLGHVYESITLAKEIEKLSEIEIVSLSDSPEVLNKLEENGFHPSVVQESEIAEHLKDPRPDTVLINLPWIGKQLVEEIDSKLSSRIVAHGDPSTNLSPEAVEYCDVVVSSNKVDEGFGGRKYTDENGTLHLVGPRYFVLRPEFYEYSESYETEDLEEVLMMFGASDPSNLTSHFLSELLSSERNYDINVVVGAGFQYHDELEEVLNKHDTKTLTVYEDVNNVSELMHNSDFVLTSPGLSSLEALFIGVPTLAVYQNERQEEAYRTAEFAYHRGEIRDIEEAMQEIYDMFTQQDGYAAEIGRGKDEIVSTILNEK